MSTTTIIAGIDVSKARLDVHVNGEDRVFSNDRAGFRPLAGWLRGHGVGRIVLESTGRYHRGVHQSLHGRGIEVVVVNPRNARRFAQAGGGLGKTDRLDARMLAAFGRAMPGLAPSAPRADALGRLEDRMVLREMQVDHRAQLRQLLSEATDPASRAHMKKAITAHDRWIAALDADIAALVKEDPELSRRHGIFLSVCGIGPVAAAALCCWMPELGETTNREAAALLGVAPHPRDSGTLSGARHIGGGRRRPRDVMYMAAMAASQHNPQMHDFYSRLRDRGKPHKVAIVAVMRKLVVLVNALLRHMTTWSAEVAAAGCAAPAPGARPARRNGFVRVGDALGRTMAKA